jgi:hypothetical protein
MDRRRTQNGSEEGGRRKGEGGGVGKRKGVKRKKG